MAEQERAELFIVDYLDTFGESKTRDIRHACEKERRPLPARTVERALKQLVSTKAIRRVRKGFYAGQ
jgi:hypothetical protein